jgi:hypothetical protein
MNIDLSAVFCSEPDKGQEVHDSMPPEIWRHLAACFTYKAELCNNPGVYRVHAEIEEDEWE